MSPLRDVILLAAAVALSPACKSKHDEPLHFPANAGAGAPAGEALPPPVDALTPPPPPRPPDLSTPPAAAATMNGHPNGPKQSEFDPVQTDAQRRVQACLDAIPATTALPGGVARLAIKYEVGNDGKAKDVAVTGEVPPEVLSCGRAAIEGVTFPKFEGGSVRNAFSLTYSRAQAPDLSAR